MSAPALFVHPDHGAIRALAIDGEPWFAAADICAALEHTNTTVALRMLDACDIRQTTRSEALNLGISGLDPRVQSLNLVSEPGFFDLALRSQAPGAKAFRRWVTHEVLPAIRRTGSYSAPQVPQTFGDALRLAAELQDQKERALAQVEALTPSAASWDHLAAGTGDYMVADAAKILSRDPAITTGRQRLFAALADWRWVYKAGHPKTWTPYQAQVDAGRLVLHTYEHQDRVCHQVRVTPKGLAEIHRRLGGSAPLALDPPTLFAPEVPR